MPASRADRILVRAETLVATPGSFPSVELKNEEAPEWGLLVDLGYRLAAELGEVELRLPDEAGVLRGLGAANARRVLHLVGAELALDHVDRHDLEARVALLVEVVGADDAHEALGLGHL